MARWAIYVTARPTSVDHPPTACSTKLCTSSVIVGSYNESTIGFDFEKRHITLIVAIWTLTFKRTVLCNCNIDSTSLMSCMVRTFIFKFLLSLAEVLKLSVCDRIGYLRLLSQRLIASYRLHPQNLVQLDEWYTTICRMTRSNVTQCDGGPEVVKMTDVKVSPPPVCMYQKTNGELWYFKTISKL